ncbi:MAG: HAMP domain-containing sensor histidine kinase [Bryobacteraceae bacterium]|nr:HAMP domain-containing sensor histidine kinase [Bryobacteraceae bacterium]
MWPEHVQRLLVTRDAEADPGFRAEVLRLSHIGLQVLGTVEIAVSCVMVGASLFLDPREGLVSVRLGLGAAIVGLGLMTLAASRMKSFEQWYRSLASLSGVMAAAAVTWFLLRMNQIEPGSKDFIPGNLTLLTLVTVAAVPMRPLHTFLFGTTILASYLALSSLTPSSASLVTGTEGISVVFIILLTVLATALSAVLYDQRRTAWNMYRDMLEASENLRMAEARNLLAENAASVGRLAAALSHELNSPIGVLVSSVDTLLLLAARQATSAEAEQQRLVVLQNDLRRSIRTSTTRLGEIVARMQRFTNLDKADVQLANINEILSDVTALLEPNWKGKAEVVLELQPVPPLVCRPQQLSALFAGLLGNAVEATNGDGRVSVATREKGTDVEIEIADNGHGLAEEQVRDIFDPGFRVEKGRVSSGNWSMFSSRQIIREHGGDITLTSAPGKGTIVIIILPADNQSLT